MTRDEVVTRRVLGFVETERYRRQRPDNLIHHVMDSNGEHHQPAHHQPALLNSAAYYIELDWGSSGDSDAGNNQ
jgi:hypothetical protein